MKYIYIYAIAILIVTLGVASILTPAVKYNAEHSESNCVGHTCTDYLLEHMGDRIYTPDTVEICQYANWADCNNNFNEGWDRVDIYD